MSPGPTHDAMRRSDESGAVRRARIMTGVSIIVVVPLGLATKRCHVGGLEWIAENVGGALYVVFFCLAAMLVWPRARAGVVALVVLLATCAVELLQLWHPPWLEAIRGTLPGALVLGSTFVWADFPWYFVGAVLGWGWMRLIARGLRDQRHRAEHVDRRADSV
jgi:prepilin signal peptidase PulO-like enzyme (type II secretory pathway)